MPQYDQVLGVYAPEIPWVPTPAHIVRRFAIFDVVDRLPPGEVLELGCGAGAILYDLKRRGFSGKGIDTSKSALQIARILHSQDDTAFGFGSRIDAGDKARYDYVFAFEVLEHIEEDVRELRKWCACLKADGKLVLSVPAHRRKWGLSDQWAGHVRRYDREDIEALVAAVGFEIVQINCYGYPLMNMMTPLREYMSKRKMTSRKPNGSPMSARDATSESGSNRVSEGKIFWVYSNALAKPIFRFFQAVQRKFYRSSRGLGFLVVAEKPKK